MESIASLANEIRYRVIACSLSRRPFRPISPMLRIRARVTTDDASKTHRLRHAGSQPDGKTAGEPSAVRTETWSAICWRSAIRRAGYGRPWRCDRARGAVWARRRRRCDRATVRRALAVALDAQVVVDNRPGLGAAAAPAFVASAPADGRTLLMNTSAHAYTAALSERLPYDPIADFVPVAAVTSQAYVLVANPSAGLRSAWPIWRALGGHVRRSVVRLGGRGYWHARVRCPAQS